MTGPFRNPRTATLFVVFFVHVIIQRIEGYPNEGRKLYSFGDLKEPVHGRVALTDNEPTTTVARDYERESEVSGESFRYGESRVSLNGDNGDSSADNRFYKKWTRYSEQEDDDGAEDKDMEDVIMQLIDDVFLSPEKWAETLVDPFDILDDQTVKVQKPRSPSDPPKKLTPITHSNGNDRIIFPDNMPKRRFDPNTVVVPKCEGSTFCVDPPFYLSDNEVEEALKEHFIPPITEPPSISQRIGPINGGNGLCLGTDQTIQPKSGVDDTDQWRIIYNNENYVQSVTVQICQNPENPCELIEGITPGYITSCKQNYIYRHLVGLGSNGTTLIPIRLPSSCCCHVALTTDIKTRLGITSD